MSKNTRKPCIISTDLYTNPSFIDVYVNSHWDIVIKLGDEYLTIRPHDASILSDMLKKCALTSSEKIRAECLK